MELQQGLQLRAELLHVDLAKGPVFVLRVNAILEILRLLFGKLDFDGVVAGEECVRLILPLKYLRIASVLLFDRYDEDEAAADA